MAPKKKEYSTDSRSLVIEHFLNGDSYAEIAKKVLIPRPTVQSIVKNFKETKCIPNLSGRGRKRKTISSVDGIIQQKIELDRQKFASSVKMKIEKELGVYVRANIVRNRLHEIGFNGRIARKKPFVNKINRGKRVVYAKMIMTKSFHYWKHVRRSDESKFNLFGSNGKTMVWRLTTEEYDPKCTVPTVKNNDGTVMVWGCFSRNGIRNLYFIEGTMDRFIYRQILQKNLLQSAKKLILKNSFVFQHDNDPKHTAGVVKD